MHIKQIYTDSFLRNFNYLIVSEKKEVFCVDPWDGEQLSKELDKLGGNLTSILITHDHPDHIRGVNFLKKKYDAKIYAHKVVKRSILEIDKFISEGDIIDIEEGVHLEVVDTPGHMDAHLCFLVKEAGKSTGIFAGDALFNAGVGNCRLGGDPEILYQTVCEKLDILDDDIILYSSHDFLENNLKFTLSIEKENTDAKKILESINNRELDTTSYLSTIGVEKKINTFLRRNSVELCSALDAQSLTDKEIFLKLRSLRDQW